MELRMSRVKSIMGFPVATLSSEHILEENG
jgi:hypothetical protein